MNKFRYIHRDGRTGVGNTSYNAVVDALGKEADCVIDAMDRLLTWTACQGNNNPYIEECVFIDCDGDIVGTLQR